MQTIKGPALFLAQYLSDIPPFNNLHTCCNWAASLGFKGVQIPSWDARCLDLKLAATSKTYADEFKGILNNSGLELTELTSHLQGQLIAVNPAFDLQFEQFAPAEFRGRPKERTAWAVQQLLYAAKASQNLGLTAHATFSGALLWHTIYPWPQRNANDVQNGFDELAKRWLPILNAFDEAGVDLCFEIHPGEDLHDGISFERFLKATNNHPRVKILYDPSHLLLQQINYLDYIDIYHEFIKMFHVKDAEFNPTGRSGVYGGYQNWIDRPGRFRSLGDGQINFKSIFSKLTQYNFPGWAVLEWECCLKDQEQGATEGAALIKNYIIKVTDTPFDNFTATQA
jgi:sugar phosphate isomerase/epimerase